MGTVFLAHEARLGRKVALKLLAPELARDERFRARFLRESQLAAAIDHPHIVPVYQAGEAEGTLFLAMRYVEGTDLRSLLAAEGALEPARAAALLEQVASALEAAHAHGLIHRDVKPANILLAPTGEGGEHCYLADFGLTKQTGSLGALTATGQFLGTLAYVAPEQIEGKGLDGRADLYSLACVLYECLTGTPPFRHENEAALLWAHVREPPPAPSERRPGLPGALDAVLAKGLAKAPGERYGSCRALAAALRTALAEEPAPAAAPGPPSNLPAPATPFLGREQELAELTALLARPDVRLLTLTGAGGSGKTRLALELSRTLTGTYEHGAFWVGLAPLRDPMLVLESAARALGAEQELALHIGDKQFLLLLDNFEHVMAAAPKLAELLAACPNLNVLVTSREPLHVTGEHEYPVPPLAEAEAVHFFRERARALAADLSTNGEVVEICRRLDCLPLALELAAARVKVLSPEAILVRLEQRLPLLTGGARDLPERQRTLRATIEWSYELLSPAEQHLFARLAVFAGGCTLEAAEDVCEADLDTLSSLVDKSLLRQSGERFRMLETIREYALEWLEESGEAEEMRRRHAEHFLAVARNAEEGLGGADQAAWLEVLELEHDNLRAVLSRADVDLQLELAGALWRFWRDRGHYEEGQKQLISVLERASGNVALRTKALHGVATLARARADVPLMRRYADEALGLSERLGDTAGIARASNVLGIAALLEGDYERAQELYERCRASALEAGDHRYVAVAVGNLGHLALVEGDYERALTLNRESLALDRKLGYPEGIAISLLNVGFASFRLRRYEEAKAMIEESLALLHELRDRHMIAFCLSLAGSFAASRERLEQAARLLAMAEALEMQIGAHGLEPPEMQLHEETAAMVHERLDTEQLAREQAAGRAASLDEAVAYAVQSLQ